jgi:hypothetical protein
VRLSYFRLAGRRREGVCSVCSLVVDSIGLSVPVSILGNDSRPLTKNYLVSQALPEPTPRTYGPPQSYVRLRSGT